LQDQHTHECLLLPLLLFVPLQVTRERIRQIEAKAIRQLRAHHISPGSVMADYQLGPMADKQLASRTSSGTKKQK
jgi:hypothetical protein